MMEPKVLLVLLGCFAVGVGLLVVQYVRHHSGTRLTGVIQEVGKPRGREKTTRVQVAYVHNGREMVGVHHMQNLDAAAYRHKIGRQVKIKLNPGNPEEVQVLSTKFFSALGWVFIAIAVFGTLGNLFVW